MRTRLRPISPTHQLVCSQTNCCTGLTTVKEDVELDVDAQFNAQPQPQDELEADNDEDRRASGAYSALSGTTAHTSHSDEEVAQMDPDIIVDSLPRLAEASDDLVKHLVPQGPDTDPARWKEIRQKDSRLNKQYRNRLAVVGILQPNFGSTEYLHLRTILRALLGTAPSGAGPAAQWRPDAIILKINLAQMVHRLLILCHTRDWDEGSTDAIARLSQVFPEAVAGNEYSPEALDVWLDIAAHVCVAQLEAHAVEHHFDPDVIIENTFYNEHGVFIHLEALALTSLPQPELENALSKVDDLVTKLKSQFHRTGSTGVTAALGKLKSQFRWEALQNHAVRFHEKWKMELDNRIEEAGGVHRIVKELAKQAERRTTAQEAESLRQNALARSTLRKSLGSSSGAAALKRMEKAAAAARNVDVGNRDSANRDLDAKIAKPLPITLPIKTAKRKRFTDPQPNAVQISPDFDEETQEPFQPQQRNGTCRPAQAEDVEELTQEPIQPQQHNGTYHLDQFQDDEMDVPDPTQDEGFQNDTRETDDQRRKRAAIMSAKRGLSQSHPTSSAANPTQYQPLPHQRQRQNPGSGLPPRMEAVEVGEVADPPISDYRRAKEGAARIRIARPPKPARTRLPWSNEEENALITLIENFGGGGINYAALKDLDPTMGGNLLQRSAEDLRFKARNMRVTFMW